MAVEIIKLLSLFSGIGSFEKALQRQNVPYKLVNYCELDKFASIAYSAIHNVSEKLNLGDIKKVNEKFLPEFDLVTWGFPCSDISISGKQKGFIDENGNKTKSGLYYEGLRIIKFNKPKYSIIENVKGLMSNKFKKEFDEILTMLSQIGYNNYYKILDAKDYGIPQHRERVFIISIRKDIDNEIFTFPEPVKLRIQLNDIFKIANAKLPILHNIYGGFKETKPRLFYNYAPTIRTSAGGGHIPSVCTTDESKIEKIIGDFKIRQFTPLECWLLMGFDSEDFYNAKETGISDTQLYKMAGNSIVVDCLEAIYKNLFKQYIFTSKEG